LGICKKNGQTARDNIGDLRLVVLEVLLKGSYECVPREGVDKAEKGPPWRLIFNAIVVNAFIELWSVRYETLKTVPLVVSSGDWLFSIDLTDAYHQWSLTEESRRLFGHSVWLSQEQVQALFEAGKLPDGF
jgi:hypothetical protein